MARFAEVSEKSGTVEAICHALHRRQAFGHFLDNGTVEIDNHRPTIRRITLGRKTGYAPAPIMAMSVLPSILSLIEIAKLNDIEPEACLREMPPHIADHLTNRIEQFPPWNLTAEASEALPDGCGLLSQTT